MKVELLSYTPNALDLLLFTKNTRLNMTAGGLEEIGTWTDERKAKELAYMMGTIQSSWEFIDYVFLISKVTRAFTHQLVRHRAGTSFAQQAQRKVDMGGFTYETGPSVEASIVGKHIYHNTMARVNACYQELTQNEGVNAQDARGVLPTNIHTNIVFKANLRTLHDMALKRLCVKAQGEFQNVMREIVRIVNLVHPWTVPMLKVQCAWDCTCLFPSFPVEDCPVKKHVFNPTTGEAYGGGLPYGKEQIEKVWKEQRAEAQP